eukprot:TRINITY_DN45912_c0_g1_i1.p1 TRINITY_DN45912_c0_g1~~TRINITY_DN45912_c0_g1_i1.p1  ORF type:complete len:412 (+),score=148.51 TRINITY_DN45912_c0_g1_i1:38-1273(+)
MSVQCVSRLLARVRYLRPQALVLSTRYRLPVQGKTFSRTLSTTTSTLSQAPTMARSDQALLHSHSLKVPSFGGSLWVTSPFNVRVKPIGTFDHPNLDKAFVKVYGPDKSMAELVEISVKQEGHKLSVTCSTVDMSIASGISVEVEVPIVHNINLITTGQGNISCKDMVESNFCHLTSESGSITVSRIKTANLIIQSEGGGVVCKGAIQGSVSIVTGEGSVIADKRFMGPTLDITTDQGDIKIASCYSDQSKFSTRWGNMVLRNLHNESYVAVYEQGKVTMQGVDGCTNVFMKKGELDIQISHVGNESRLHVEEGDIKLKIADNQPVKVCVTGTEVETDQKFAQFGAVETKEDNYQHYLGTIMPDQFSPTCQVLAEKGKVMVESQDWATSMGFKLPGGVPLPPDLDIGIKRQ